MKNHLCCGREERYWKSLQFFLSQTNLRISQKQSHREEEEEEEDTFFEWVAAGCWSKHYWLEGGISHKNHALPLISIFQENKPWYQTRLESDLKGKSTRLLHKLKTSSPSRCGALKDSPFPNEIFKMVLEILLGSCLLVATLSFLS